MKEWEIRHTVKCKLLDGEIIKYDLCSDNFKGELNYVYLGKGIVYQVDGVIQDFSFNNEKHIWHFWRNKTKEEFEQESTHKEALNQIKQTNHIVYTTTDGENFSMKEKAIQHQEELNKKYVWVVIELVSYGLYSDKKIIKIFQTEHQAKEHLYKSPNNNLYIIKKELE